MTRRPFKEWEVVATLIEQGIVIPCFRCKLPLPLPTKPNMVQREHIHELKLGGPDVPANCRFSHYDCHSIITNGTKATSAGSSKHRIAKARQGDKDRLIQKPKPSLAMSMRCRRCGEDCQDGVCPNCGPPVQRPFQKRQAVRGVSAHATFRWNAVIWYRTEKGPIGVDHDIEELHGLHDLVERGPDWRAIERIEIKLERYDRTLAVEEAAKL